MATYLYLRLFPGIGDDGVDGGEVDDICVASGTEGAHAEHGAGGLGMAGRAHVERGQHLHRQHT